MTSPVDRVKKKKGKKNLKTKRRRAIVGGRDGCQDVKRSWGGKGSINVPFRENGDLAVLHGKEEGLWRSFECKVSWHNIRKVKKTCLTPPAPRVSVSHRKSTR